MRQKFIRRLKHVGDRVDDLLVRLEDIQCEMGTAEEADEINIVTEHLRDALYALNDLSPEQV